MRQLILDDDRIFPAEPKTRAIARQIFTEIERRPLISMHGHVDATVLAKDEPFANPAQLLVVPDHYVMRMLVSHGVSLDSLGIPRRDGAPVETDPRKVWRTFCAGWRYFRGTPSRLWLTQQLRDIFNVTTEPSQANADELYDHIDALLREPSFRPRALFDRFGLEILATTDSPLSDLAAHRAIADSDWNGVVVPTFRPDALVHVNRNGWKDAVARLAAVTDVDTGDYNGFLAALRRRRAYFVEHGARATDHGHATADTTPLDPSDADRIYRLALNGAASVADAAAFAANMLFQMARMSVDDGLVMQIHPGVLRDHDSQISATFGPDVGFDIPLPVDFARGLRPLLQAFGRDPRFHCVVFTIDETTYSRELAPLAGVYPALRLGVPWWFLDAPHAMLRFRE
ncbi:MAG TPA: glucuronate isomerase, partial [Acidothermaceae bacterium]